MSNVSWDNVSGNWNTGTDWSTGQPPGTLDVAILSSIAAQTVTFNLGTSAIAGIIATTDTLSVTGGTLTVNGAASFGAGLLITGGLLALDGNNTAKGITNFNGGTLEIAGGDTLAVSGPLTWTSGDVSGPGTLATSGTTTLGTSSYIDGDLTWVNSGTVLDSGFTYLNANQRSGTLATTIINQAGAIFDVTSSNSEFYNYANTNPQLFNNAGLLEDTATGTSFFYPTLANTGTISVTSGVLALEASETLGGTISVSPTAELDLASGTIAVTGTVVGGGTLAITGGDVSFPSASKTFSNPVILSSGGTLGIGSGLTLSLTGPLSWSGGNVSGPGTLATSGTTTLGTSSYIDGDLTWVNSGTVLDSGFTYLNANQRSGTLATTIINQAGAIFDVTSSNSEFYNYANTNPQLFNNAGLLEDTATGTSFFYPTLANTGTISVTSGVLALETSETLGGTISVSPTAEFDFASGTIAVTGTVVGGGTLAITGGDVSFPAASKTFSNTVLLSSGGTLGIGSGQTLSLTGPLTWNGGDVSGPGTLATSGTTTLGTSSYIDGGLTWVNSGTVLESSFTYVNLNQQGDTLATTIINQAGAIFDVTSSSSEFYNYANTSPELFNNAGLLEDTATGTSYFYPTLANTGTISVTSGVLALETSETLVGTISVSPTAELDFASGTIAVTGTVVGGGTLAIAGGDVSFPAASKTLSNPVLLSGGILGIGSGQTLSLTGPLAWNGDVSGPGTLVTSGTTTLGRSSYIDGGLTWVNSGTVLESSFTYVNLNQQDGTLATTIINQAGATFDVISAGSEFYNYANTSPEVFDNAGLREDTVTGTSYFYPTLNNSGTMEVQNGQLVLEGSVNNTGTLEAVGGGTLDLNAAITGAGNIVVNAGAKVEIASASNEAVSFNGGGTLELDAPASFTGPVYGLGVGAQIVLGGSQAVSISLQGSLVHVGLAGGGGYNLAIVGVQNLTGITLANNVLTGATTLTPFITAPSSVSLGVKQPDAISGISLGEPNAASAETFTVGLSDTTGVLLASGPGVSGAGTTHLTVTGSLSAVNAALATLTDTESTTSPDGLTITAADNLGFVAASQTIAVTVNTPPVLSNSSTITLAQSKTTSFSATLSEIGTTAGETFTVTLADAYGDLSATGAGVSGAGSTHLTIAGSLAQVSADLSTLTDTDSVVGGDTITVQASDSFGNIAAPGTISVAVAPVTTTPPSISHITPDAGSNLGSVTVTVNGTQFKADDQVAVIGANGATLDATQVRWVSARELWATFNLTGAATGTYNVQVSDSSGAVTSPGAFTVNSSPAGQLSVSLNLPQATTSGQGTGTVTYSNTGNTDIAAPLLDLSSSQAVLQGVGGTSSGNDIDILGTNTVGPAGILAPGEQGSVSFTYTPTNPTAGENVSVSVGTIAAGSSIDWSGLEAALQPPTVDAADWNNVWTDFIGLVGNTTTSLQTALSQTATELAQTGQPTDDVGTLLQDDLFQASGAMAGTYLASATDITGSASSLSLSLSRYYNGTLLGRDASSALGDGWSSIYDVTAVKDASGDVYIQAPGILHEFTLQANGTYSAGAGDPASLIVSNGLYQMNDGSGNIEAFNTAGKLGSITHANGNIIKLSYTSAGVLQQVASETTGETITFASNAQGLITSASDSDGQAVTYTYNAAGTQLLSASGPSGVTSYTYSAPTGSPTDNALTSITNPDGTQQFFTYNAQGWLASTAGTGGSLQQTYTYNGPGQVTVTNADGDSTTLLYDASGEISQTQDALGNVTQVHYNTAGDLTGAISPAGQTSSYSYNALGGLTGATDPSGGSISAAYASGTQNLTDFTNQLGNQIKYSYNAAGQETGITYDNGSGDIYQYSTAGLLTSSTDADGNTISYSYDSAGDLTKEAFSDGTANTYTYDAQGNLLTADASNGTSETYTYNAANQLTSVTNAAGQVESYTYNSKGQLASRTEPDGSVTQYSYNANGQLVELQDGSGNLLDKYTYDPAGQLIKTVTGNGASTSYLYDTDGRTKEIINLNADGSVAGYEDYTYNANSQVVDEATNDGAWSYSYDANDDLTGAVFVSTNASIQHQTISYAYDAAGNRVSQTVNGVTTDYTTNALNQYTAVGGTTCTYDANGNMTSETNSSGTTTFTYNENNQLIAENGAAGSFQYTYDALGNVVATTQNGTVTTYINDPLSLSVSGQALSSVAEVNNSSGTAEATYDYGLGLAAVSTSAGATSYYDTDLTGNVIGLSGPSGQRSASYFYLPFGQDDETTGAASNPFQFAGGLGISIGDNGLVDMRARFYDPTMGRFISADPTGLAGGADLYEYADNDPVTIVDPLGLFSLVPVTPDNIKYYWFLVRQYIQQQLGAPIEEPPFVSFFNVDTNSLPAIANNPYGEAYSWSVIVNGRNNNIDVADPAYIEQQEKISPKTYPDIPPPNAVSKFIYRIFGFSGLADGSSDISETTEIQPSPPPTASCFGCPHFTTFDGLEFDFQGAGEFIAAKSTVAGNNFQVQMRIEPEGSPASSVSIITQIAVQVGNDRVTFASSSSPNTDASRPQVVWVNGAPVTINQANPVLTLAGGTVTEVSENEYVVALNTGEEVTVNPFGDGMGLSIALAPTDGPGSVQGFFGSDDGQANDFQLPDGTVLPQPLTQAELYQQFANAWRVTDSTSLLDYSVGQTTATYTDTQYPREILTLSDFPPDLVAAAAAVVAAAGITDPTLAASAEFDYLTMGDPTSIGEDATVAGMVPTTTTPAVVTQPAALTTSVGVLAASPSIVESPGTATQVIFDVNLISATTIDTVVDYAVVPGGSPYTGHNFFSAADFGGIVPSGTVTIAAGETFAAVTIDVPNSALAALTDKWVELAITSPSGDFIYGQTAQSDIINNTPVAGPPAEPTIELLSNPQALTVYPHALTQIGNDYTLDLGQVLAGTSLPSLQFALANTGTTGSDNLSSVISGTTDAGFAVSFSQPPAQLAAGDAFQNIYVQPTTTNLGAQSETLTIQSQDTNSSDYDAILPTDTITLTDTVLVPATGTLSTTAIGFGAVRAGTSAQQLITITNTASLGAEDLDASIGTLTGAATGTGSIALLAPGQASTITVGLNTTQQGVQTGTANLDLASDGSTVNGLGMTALPPQTVAVSGTVYLEAQPTLTPPPSVILHVGSDGTAALGVANGAGYIENLLATVGAISGNITAPVASTGEIVAGASSALPIAFSTQSAGTVTGIVTLNLESDGTGIDGEGPTTIGTQTINLLDIINNYATAAIEQAGTMGTLTQAGTTYTLNLGAVTEGAAPVTAGFGVLNAAVGAADLLSGSFTAVPTAGFSLSGLGVFAALAAGSADLLPGVTLETGTTGVFSETVTLDTTGSNASGYNVALPDITIIATGTVLPLSPMLAEPTSALTIIDQPGAITGLNLSEVGNVAGETFTVTLADTNGLLSASGAGVSGAGTKNLTITGALAQVNAALATVTDTEAELAADAIAVSATDSFGNNAAAETFAVDVTPAAELVVPPSPSSEVGTLTPIPGISLSASMTNSTDIYTVTLSDTSGLLSATGGGVTGAGTTQLTISGSLSAVNAALSTLQDIPTLNDTISLNATDSLGLLDTTQTIAVSVPSGSTTINGGTLFADAGSGSRVFFVTAAVEYVTTEGSNTIIASSGVPTISASTGNPLVFGGGSSLDFIGGSGAATVIGGTAANSVTGGSGSLLLFAAGPTTFTPGSGSSTIIGGPGNLTAALGTQGGLIFGGSGMNDLSAAPGASAMAYLIGVGVGDTLTASGAGEALLIGGAGAETLNAAASSGNLDAVIGGTGAESIVGGANSNYFVAGSGNETLTGGSGINAYAFVSGSTTRIDTITDFTEGNGVILLYGYDPNAASTVFSNATVSGGSTFLTLPDHTTIVMSGVTNLNAANVGG